MAIFRALFDVVFRRTREESDMAEELRFHLQARAEHLEKLGVPSEEAARQARVEFGSIENYKEHCREALGRRIWDELHSDVRYVFRTLRKMPVFTAIVVLSLAVSIGVNLTCFASLYAMVLRPFGYHDVDSIMAVFDVRTHSGDRDGVATANYLDWKKRSRSFKYLAAYREWDANVSRVGHPDHINAAQTTSELFGVLGIRPQMGRTFTAAECQPGRDGVAVVSRGFWHTRLGSVAEPLGKNIFLNGRSYIVIGVMPDDFNLPLASELWVPLTFTQQEKSDRETQQLSVIGKLRAGITQAQAQSDLNGVATLLASEYPRTNNSHRVLVTSLTEAMTSESRSFLTVLTCAALFVLLLGSINVGGLQMARAISRQKEIALRRALGANSWRIGRQLLIENVMISLAGGMVGLGLASWHLSIVRAGIPASVYQIAAGLKNMRINGQVAAYGLVLAILAGILCSVPALIEATHGGRKGEELNEVLRDGGRTSRSSSSRRRWRSALVAGEVALAFVLLVGAGLMVTTLRKIATRDLGYNPANLLTARMALSGSEYNNPSRVVSFYDSVLRHLNNRQDVDAGAVVGDAGPVQSFYIEGREHSQADELMPELHPASSRYLHAMELPLLRGRWISDDDDTRTRNVIVLSASVVRHYWPHSDPLGQRVRVGSSKSPWLTVVGVTGDTNDWFSGRPEPAAYVSCRQYPQNSMEFVVRGRKESVTLAGALREAAQALNGEQPVYGVVTREEQLYAEVTGVRNSASLMGTYAVIALLLSVMGIYSIASFFVTQRKPEIAVRMSLGATRQSILQMVLGQSFRLALYGLAVGVPFAALLMLGMSRVLYGLVPVEPSIFIVFMVILSGSAALAGYIPAYRASRLDPVVILRQE